MGPLTRTWQAYHNPNAGRFYLCHRVAQKDEEGEPKVTASGKVIYDFAAFHWLDEHPFARVLQKHAPAIIPFIMTYGKAYGQEDEMWPPQLLSQMFVSTDGDKAIIRGWREDPYGDAKPKRKAKAAPADESDEPKPKGRKRTKASMFADDEAEESDN